MQKRILSLVFECIVGKFERLHERLLFTLHGRINCQPTSESFALPENAARKSNKLNGLKPALRCIVAQWLLWRKGKTLQTPLPAQSSHWAETQHPSLWLQTCLSPLPQTYSLTSSHATARSLHIRPVFYKTPKAVWAVHGVCTLFTLPESRDFQILTPVLRARLTHGFACLQARSAPSFPPGK